MITPCKTFVAIAVVAALNALATPSAKAQHVPQTPSAAVTIKINANIAYQTMEGFGTSVRVFDDPHMTGTYNSATGRSAIILSRTQQNEILHKLYVDLRLTRVRAVSPDTAAGRGIEPVNDNDDPDVSDLTKFKFGWKNLDAHCDYIKRARSRGATVSFLSPLNRELWMRTETPLDVAEYSEWLLAQVNRCSKRGVKLPFLSAGNEPSDRGNPLPPTFIRDVIKVLGPRLRAKGLMTKFVVPDDIRSSDAARVTRVVLADPVARSYVGALATHLYDEPLAALSQMKELSDQYQLPLWMTEFSSPALPTASMQGGAMGWALLMQELITTYNVSAIDYMWGFFGQQDKSQLITIDNHVRASHAYYINKEYYVIGQYSRFVRPGAKMISSSSNDDAVKVTAFREGATIVVVIVNTASTSKTLSIELPETSVTAMRPTLTDLRGDENWRQLPWIAVDKQTLETTIPAFGMTTFTSQ